MTNEQITRLLLDMEQGDREAMDRLVPLVYDELQKLARVHLRSERSGHTLNTTALVHESYLKLVDQTRIKWQGRGHFFAVASMVIRRILVNYARDRGRQKRGGEFEKISLDEGLGVIATDRSQDILMVDDLLERLAQLDPRATQVVECRFFGGLTVEETAEALDLGSATVKRSWRFAKAWLKKEMEV